MPRLCPAVAIVLTPAERTILEGWSRERTGPWARTERAALLLRAATGEGTGAIARALDLDRETVRMWRWRWADAAPRRAAVAPADQAAVLAEVLADAPRTGRPLTFGAAQVAQIIAVACEDPAAGSGRPVSHWTPRELAAEVVARHIVPGISARHVGRILDFGRGRPAAAPQPVLAHAAARRPGLRRQGAHGL